MKKLNTVLIAVVMVVLILDNRCAIDGAAEGITLCLKMVIPSLFPFFVLCSILTSTVSTLPTPVLKLFGVSPSAGGALLSGLLGGYPVGAKSISQAYTEGSITLEEAQRLLPICNQCGPAFIFGITACLFYSPAHSALIWVIHIFAAIILARLLPPTHSAAGRLPNAGTNPISPSTAMSQSIRSMSTVCGWIIIFRILFSFLNRWFLWAMPHSLRIVICGILELANGCTELYQITDIKTRFVLATLLTGFGGVCVSLQSISLLHPEISPHNYFPGKLTQTGISTLTACILTGKLYILGFVITIIGLTTLTITKISKKTVAFPGKIIYNDVIKETRI